MYISKTRYVGLYQERDLYFQVHVFITKTRCIFLKQDVYFPGEIVLFQIRDVYFKERTIFSRREVYFPNEKYACTGKLVLYTSKRRDILRTRCSFPIPAILRPQLISLRLQLNYLAGGYGD